MRHRSRALIGVSFAAILAGLLTPATSQAALLGNTLKIVDATSNIITGDSWTVTAEVDDFLGNPVSGAAISVGTQEPSTGCGSDLSAAACTGLATKPETADANGRLQLSQPAALNTFVVLYLSDNQGAVDPTSGQSTLIRTHNNYPWAGPASEKLQQYTVGDAIYMPGPSNAANHWRTASGTGAATSVRTQVSTDGGTTWRTVARGFSGGVFPITGSRTAPVDHVFLTASKAGTYSVRVIDDGGTYEDPGSSPVVTITVTGRSVPQWLQRTNSYRASLGLAPVADNSAYDAALAKHVNWMNIHRQLSHSETPGSKGYTKAGNEAAAASDLAFGRPTATNSVDGWIGAPFHASCLLNAYWAVGGFASRNGWSGEWCHSDLQTLDLATGANSPLRASLRKNYTFPSTKMQVPLSIALNGNEGPDPVAGCGSKGVGPYWSVPVIFRVARPPASDAGLRRARATLKTKSGRLLRKTCLLTGTTYQGPDSGSTQIGRLILGDSTSGRWAILLAKAGTLQRGGTYTAALTDGRFTQRTTFTLARR
jgi:uncharacterized protein YkwD